MLAGFMYSILNIIQSNVTEPDGLDNTTYCISGYGRHMGPNSSCKEAEHILKGNCFRTQETHPETSIADYSLSACLYYYLTHTYTEDLLSIGSTIVNWIWPPHHSLLSTDSHRHYVATTERHVLILYCVVCLQFINNL